MPWLQTPYLCLIPAALQCNLGRYTMQMGCTEPRPRWSNVALSGASSGWNHVAHGPLMIVVSWFLLNARAVFVVFLFYAITVTLLGDILPLIACYIQLLSAGSLFFSPSWTPAAGVLIKSNVLFHVELISQLKILSFVRNQLSSSGSKIIISLIESAAKKKERKKIALFCTFFVVTLSKHYYRFYLSLSL